MRRTHPLEVGHLVMGLVFLGLAATWGLHELGLVRAADVDWLVPLALVAAGLLGLAGFAVREVRGRRGTAEAAYDDEVYAPSYAPADDTDDLTSDPTPHPENGENR